MKQVSQNYKTGAIRLEDANVPALRSGGVLVRTHYSVVSAGTEGMKVKEGKMSYLGKARARPDQVKKVLNTLRQQGLVATYQKVMNKLDKLTPLGYSLSGEVIAVGAGAEEFHVGQRVACGGAGYANHADVNFVPKNLVVPVPDPVFDEARGVCHRRRDRDAGIPAGADAVGRNRLRGRAWIAGADPGAATPRRRNARHWHRHRRYAL